MAVTNIHAPSAIFPIPARRWSSSFFSQSDPSRQAFTLLIPEDGLRLSCRVVWQRDYRMGVDKAITVGAIELDSIANSAGLYREHARAGGARILTLLSTTGGSSNERGISIARGSLRNGDCTAPVYFPNSVLGAWRTTAQSSCWDLKRTERPIQVLANASTAEEQELEECLLSSNHCQFSRALGSSETA